MFDDAVGYSKTMTTIPIGLSFELLLYKVSYRQIHSFSKNLCLSFCLRRLSLLGQYSITKTIFQIGL